MNTKFKYRAILIIIFAIINVIMIYTVNKVNLLPLNFIIIITIIFLLASIIITTATLKKIPWYVKRLVRGLSLICLILITVINVGLIYNATETINFLASLGGDSYDLYTYQVYVNNNSTYQNINDLENKNISLINNNLNSSNQSKEELHNKIEYTEKYYSSNYELINAVKTNETEALLIEKSQYNLMEINDPDSLNNLHLVYEYEIYIQATNKGNDIDTSKEAFTIYLTGLDNYGDIQTISYSDVNMIITVNPNTKVISLVSIPRDYYVTFPETGGAKDKLTHASMYGTDMSIGAVENLLNLEIDHYLKINFTTLVNLIDAIGPIEVHSNYTFCSYTYCYNEGINIMDSAQALEFSRERLNLPGGDLTRAANQQLVINSLVELMLSPDILVNYGNLLEALKYSLETTLSDEDISELVKAQLTDLGDWTTTNYVINGTGSYELTYTYPYKTVPVVLEDSTSLEEAKTIINNTLLGIST